MEIRPFTMNDLEREHELLLAADDARVMSLESFRHWRSSQPPAAENLNLVATDGGRVVGVGGAGRNIWTSTPNAGGAYVTVAAAKASAMRCGSASSSTCARSGSSA